MDRTPFLIVEELAPQNLFKSFGNPILGFLFFSIDRISIIT
jgi:hypothetical protein